MKRKYNQPIPKPTSPKKTPKILGGILKLAILGVFGYGIFWFLGWDTVQVSNITVAGQVSISPDDMIKKTRQEIIRSQKPWYKASNILLAPAGRIEGSLTEAYPRIKSVKVEKSLPDTLNITIEEREPYWKVCFETECRGVSEDGVVIDRVSTATDYPILDLGRNPVAGQTLLSAEERAWFQLIQAQFEEQLQRKPTRLKAEVKVEEEIKVLHVYLDEDTYVLLDDETDLPYQIVAFAVVFDSIPEGERLQKSYYDIRVKKRIYYQ
jgi:cell division septal protein FtsQ